MALYGKNFSYKSIFPNFKRLWMNEQILYCRVNHRVIFDSGADFNTATSGPVHWYASNFETFSTNLIYLLLCPDKMPIAI